MQKLSNHAIHVGLSATKNGTKGPGTWLNAEICLPLTQKHAMI